MKSMKSCFRKIKNPSSSSAFLVLIVFTCIFVNSSCRQYIKTSPDYTIYTGQGNGTAIKISPDEKFVMVGFSNGALRIYDSIGSDYYYECYYGHISKIIDI